MTTYVDDLLESDKDQMGWLGGLSSDGAGNKLDVEEAPVAVVDRAESIYGWCGVCRSFTDFPHECAGEHQIVVEEAA
jgi:hypothetical protein